MLRRKRGLIGVFITSSFVLIAILAPYIAPYDPYKLVGPPFSPPSEKFILGTNDLGQDVFSELLYGTRISLLISLIAGICSTFIAAAFGILSGYYQKVGSFFTGLMDIFLLIPFVPFVILLAANLGPGLLTVLLAISILTWPAGARTIRSQTISVKNKEFMESIKALGASDGYTIMRYILPNVASLIYANAILRIVDAILLEAALSFLGLGDPTQKSWGMMLYFAQQRTAFSTGAWWWFIPPGLCITLLALGFNLLASVLEDVLNPRSKYITWR
ncbi:MAG: ABC transporter permease [Candidatus Bathyarchaeia archaeon]